MNLNEQRGRFVALTKKQLMGMQLKDDLLVGQKPLDRFFTGLLFPIIEGDGLADEVSEQDLQLASDDKEEVQAIKKVKRYIPPSSAGYSFYITGNNIKLRVYFDAAQYRIDQRDSWGNVKAWRKNHLTEDGEEVEFSPEGLTQYKVFSGKARIDALWRMYADGYIVTVSISNDIKINAQKNGKDFNLDKNENTLFEVELKCIIESGSVGVYPSRNRDLLNDEEKEIELRYKDLHTYAIGHGTAANWSTNKQGKMEIWTDFIPVVEVPQVTADTGGEDKALGFDFLKECIVNKDVLEELNIFILKYDNWICLQEIDAQREEEEDKAIASKIIQNLNRAKERMFQGLELLKHDKDIRIAFSVANEAMLKQWISTDNNKKTIKNVSSYRWRPFQLAFILMTLESVTNEDSDFRDTLDLIWFPTGGGKTEAYLGLMAFLFIYRRLKYPASSGGTVTIMRYTLRLLTMQQFLRASKVIFALELIRQKNVQKFGEEPFTIGLWVGGQSSPNTFNQTIKFIEEEKYSKLVLNSCPWCATQFQKDNYRVSNESFHFTCINRECDFGKEVDNVLPCNVVDYSLYKQPPSLLISTVDKFAMLAWKGQSGSFFGKNGNRPPELIIQDELHLISSALGSIVGLYEAGIDSALISRGMRVKYVASTATIKNATKQVATLFAREMSIFPPPGLRYNDSYFAKTVPLDQKPGRLYIGYLAPMLDRQHCLEPLAGVLLSNPVKLFSDEPEFLDRWWTQIVYHGSLKGVGNSRTLYQSGVKKYLDKFTMDNLKEEIEDAYPNFLESERFEQLSDFQKITDPEIKSIVDKYLPVREIKKLEILTSNQTAEKNAEIFTALGINKDNQGAVDVALATNMISVGLDVSRLALMIINGQPLTTAEYIQASSRVGRGETPGIVFVNYYKTQARSLSHYENFRSYHESFYRYVEASSLTPFTYQARSRALHAALVIAIRHADIGFLDNNSAGLFDQEESSIKRVIKILKIRSKHAIGTNNEQVSKTSDHIDKLTAQWQKLIDYERDELGGRSPKIKFESDLDKNNITLLCRYGEDSGMWQTLQSMRNVESSSMLKLIKGVKKFHEE